MDEKTLNIKNLIEKEFGDNIIQNANAIIDTENVIIPVSPRLDIVLGGGIQEGSFVTLTGQPKCGKTTTALFFAANCQDLKYGGELAAKGRNVFYLNIEGRLKKRDLLGIPHLDRERFHVITSTPGNILTAEKSLSIAERYINEVTGSIIIIDSYSALCTETEITKGMDEMQRADGPKLLAKFCRKVANVVPINRNIIIGITHLMGNPTGYGAAFKEKSGQAISYQVDVKLKALKFNAWEDKNKVQIGQEVEWQCITSSLGPPGQKCVSYIRYGNGIDIVRELVSLGLDLGLIKQGGAWYTYEEEKIQGLESVLETFRNNLSWQQKLKDSIHNLL